MDATMENKMGLPPPYEPDPVHPPPPPAYAPTAPVLTPPAVRQAVPPVVVVTPSKLGPGPTGMSCPHCHASIVTSVEYTPNNKTHIIAAILCVVGGCCCLCCVPYCMRSLKTANHSCPNCKAFIGGFRPS